MADYTTMWTELGLDLERHDQLLQLLGQVYTDLYLSQAGRPAGMGYFDFVISEVHGLRVQELQEHKARGGTVVGTFCVFVPEELILAAGGVCVGLCAGTDFPASDADAILPRNICPLIRSAVGFKLGRLCPYVESCDLVVGETTCDGKKKTWEILGQQVPIHVMELPQKVSSRGNGMWRGEIAAFAQRLEELSGRPLTSEALAGGISAVNGKRAALARLYELRKTNPVPISGKDALLISQIAFYDDVGRFTQSVNTLCDELEARVQAGDGLLPGNKRILISGTPMAIPNWKLHHIVETSGGVVVCEESCTGTRYFEGQVEPAAATLDSQLDALAARYVDIPCACFTPNEARLDNVVRYAREWHADGVIDYTLPFCHCYNVEHELLRQRLRREGIPLLHIESDYSMSDFGQLATRVKAFIETLG
jgi:benzoyl-CoA reductase/2-hydroxyglutaryl-CoA dehydratase subunit BcrC/BadD/HgdB